MYKANLNPEPMVYIASRNYTNRNGVIKYGDTQVKQLVKIYSNIKQVELFVNNKSLGKKTTDSPNRIIWEVPFNNGINVLEAKAEKEGKTFSDKLEINFLHRPAILKDSIIPFTTLRINIGAYVEYIDNENYTWFADQNYLEGSFGYISGGFFKFTKNRIRTIKDTPLYYSFNEGIKEYKMDVPDGNYELELHFIDNENINSGKREFSIEINNKKVENSLNILETVGQNKALIKKYTVEVKNNQSITIAFNKTSGLSTLSAIKLEKK